MRRVFRDDMRGDALVNLIVAQAGSPCHGKLETSLRPTPELLIAIGTLVLRIILVLWATEPATAAGRSEAATVRRRLIGAASSEAATKSAASAETAARTDIAAPTKATTGTGTAATAWGKSSIIGAVLGTISL